jgi:hypothetical protein
MIEAGRSEFSGWKDRKLGNFEVPVFALARRWRTRLASSLTAELRAGRGGVGLVLGCGAKGRQTVQTIPALSARMLAQSRVIAKGKRIRDIERLVAQYGGKPARWVKKSSPVLEIESEEFEYHWYEHPDVGRVELKQKRVNRQ